MTNGKKLYFEKYFEQIVDQVGGFLLKTFNMIYMNLTVYNVVLVVMKYLPLIVYMERFIRSTYRESQRRMKQRNAEIADILLKLDIVNAKLLCQEAEFRDREEVLRRCTEQLHVARAQVHRVIEDEDLRQRLKLPIDLSHLHVNNNSEEELEPFEELIMEYKYDQKGESADEKVPLDKDTSGIFNGDTFDNIDENKDYTIKVVKVAKVYRMSYLQHYLKHKRLQQARQAVLKKKTNNTQKLFNDWYNDLNAVTRMEHTGGTSTGEATGEHRSYEVLRTDGGDEGEWHQDCDVQNQNQCLTYGNYCKDLAPESEIIATDYTSTVDNRHEYETPAGGRPALFVITEETNSQIEIDSLVIQ